MTKLEVLDQSHERIIKLLTTRRFSSTDRAELIRQLDRLQQAMVAEQPVPVKPFWEFPALPSTAFAPAPPPAAAAVDAANPETTYPHQL